MGSTYVLQLLFLTISCVKLGKCDYNCICNYNVEKSVFATMNDQASPTGYLYEFDCKQQLDQVQVQSDWYAIAFEHQISYIKKDPQTQIQVCPGSPPSEDLVTTIQPSTEEPTVPSSTTTSVPSTSVSTSTMQATMQSTVASTKVQTSTTVSTDTTQTTETSASTISTVETTTQQATTAATTQTSQSLAIRTTMSSTSGSTTALMIGDTSLCSSAIQQTATSTDKLLQFNKSCYLLMTHPVHWLEAELRCNSGGGHLFHILSKEEQAFFYNYLRNNYNHSVWTGLNDQMSEGQFVWSSGAPLSFQNWANHSHFSDVLEDCIIMDMHVHSGKWDEMECDFIILPYICQYAISQTGGQVLSTAVSPSFNINISEGNTNLCPDNVKHNSLSGHILGQYERGCYELLLNTKVSWEHGENICQSKGGHLAHISNANEQAFIEGFMQKHNPNNAIWIGLHDTMQEGNFEWTAGNAVTYTNWITGHVDNTLGGHNSEDCVVFVPQIQGKWDDVTCGYEEIFGHDSGEVHYALCQYKIHSFNPAAVG